MSIKRFGYALLLLLVYSCSNKNNQEQVELLNDSAIIFEKIQEDAVVPSILGDIVMDETSTYSLAFLRYSRNAFFARHGYEFLDSNLNLFFSKQKWYKSTGRKVTLDKNEQEIVDFLKAQEAKIQIDYKLIEYKTLYKGYPLYYIIYNPFFSEGVPEYYDDGHFVLLPKDMVWTLNCTSIPPEYLEKHEISRLECIDVRALINQQISLDTIIGELKVELEGPSDDYESLIIGVNQKGKLTYLFNQNVEIGEITSYSDSLFLIVGTERCDLIGTYFCPVKFTYNSNNQELVKLEPDVDFVSLDSKVLEKVKIVNHNNKYTLEPGTSVIIYKYYEKEGYLIETQDRKGWVTEYDIDKFLISYAD